MPLVFRELPQLAVRAEQLAELRRVVRVVPERVSALQPELQPVSALQPEPVVEADCRRAFQAVPGSGAPPGPVSRPLPPA